MNNRIVVKRKDLNFDSGQETCRERSAHAYNLEHQKRKDSGPVEIILYLPTDGKQLTQKRKEILKRVITELFHFKIKLEMETSKITWFGEQKTSLEIKIGFDNKLPRGEVLSWILLTTNAVLNSDIICKTKTTGRRLVERLSEYLESDGLDGYEDVPAVPYYKFFERIDELIFHREHYDYYGKGPINFYEKVFKNE